jgi:hypothetical protein
VGVRVDHHAQAAGGNSAEIFFVQSQTLCVIHDFLQHAWGESTAAARTRHRLAAEHFFHRGSVRVFVRRWV